MDKREDCCRKLALAVPAMFEKESGKFEYGDFDLVADIIHWEITSTDAKAGGWRYSQLTPEEKSAYDLRF